MRRAGAGFIAASVLALACAGSAHAGTQSPTKSLGKAGGLEYLFAKFPSVVSTAGATAVCDESDRVIGGGGIIGGGVSSSLWVNGPSNTLDGWHAEGSSIDGATETTYAICGPNGVDVELGGMSVPPNTFGYTQSFSCDTGSVISGGYSSDGTNFFVETFRPYDGDDVDARPDDGWLIRGSNPSPGTVHPTVVFFCSETLKLSYATKTVQIDPDGGASLKAKCPRKTVVTGGGYDSPAGRATGLRPWDSKDNRKTPEDGWLAAVQNITGTPLDYEVTAICVKP